MLVLSFLLKFKGIDAVNKFLGDGDDLTSKKADEVADFFKLYLNYDFLETCENPFQILTYLKRRPVLDSGELINSRYFQSMPDKYAMEALKRVQSLAILYTYDSFVEFLTSKISKEEFLQNPTLLGNITTPIKKILSFKDIDFLEQIVKHLNYNNLNNVYNEMSNYFSLDESKDFLIKTGVGSLDIIINTLSPYLKNDREATLDAILEVVLKGLDYSNVSSFGIFANTVFKRAEFIPSDIDYLAEKIYRKDNLNLMYYWVINTYAPNNKQIITKLLNEQSDVIPLLLALDEEQFVYAVNKVNEKSDKEVEAIVTSLCARASVYNVFKVDAIIDMIMKVRPRLELSKASAIFLILAGSKHIFTIIRQIALTKEERGSIFRKLEQNKMYDLLAFFGAYLLSGDKNKLIGEEVEESFDEPLKRLRVNTLQVTNN